ncbi:MAG: PorP/SprF family type IX secretion system membrane protein [Bacteroidia bacterium]|nr:PorP/SprF family type IX secretion system membrane protein [Bacteroidia bacterium]
MKNPLTSLLGHTVMYVLLLCPIFSFGQDLHFSQYDKAPSNLNPALTGIFDGDIRFTGNYRSQWYAVPVSYQTFSGAMDMKFFDRNQPTGFFSGGVRLFYDKAGDSQLSTSDLAINAAYTRLLAPKHLISFGVGLGIIQRAFKTADLLFESQWDGNAVNPSLGTQEQINNTNTLFANFSAGLNYHYQVPEKRTSMDIGIALFHINEPDQAFRDDASRKLPQRLSLYAMGSFKATEKVDFGLSAMTQSQGSYNELLFGLSGTFHVNQKRNEELAIRAGLSFRTNDALIPNIMVMYKQFTAGLSYDINSSDFKISTDQRGGPEFSFSYRITKVLPPEALKICPIY